MKQEKPKPYFYSRQTVERLLLLLLELRAAEKIDTAYAYVRKESP